MALALVALALLLQRPFCELASAAVGRGGPGTAMAAIGHAVVGHPLPAPSEPETCCATIAEDVQLISAGPLVAWMSGAPTGAALFLLAALLPTLAGSRQVARIRITSPPERSFYTRSARILR